MDIHRLIESTLKVNPKANLKTLKEEWSDVDNAERDWKESKKEYREELKKQPRDPQAVATASKRMKEYEQKFYRMKEEMDKPHRSTEPGDEGEEGSDDPKKKMKPYGGYWNSGWGKKPMVDEEGFDKDGYNPDTMKWKKRN